MVARTWRGWTRRETQAYVAYLEQTGMPAYRGTPGNRGAWILRHDDGERTEFVTLTFWESLEAIRGFAGDDLERAVLYEDDDRFLVEREETVSTGTSNSKRRTQASGPCTRASTKLRRARVRLGVRRFARPAR
jgi:heme-degrading monooxygenase HmoA